MSIINDALKKAEREKRTTLLPKSYPVQILRGKYARKRFIRRTKRFGTFRIRLRKKLIFRTILIASIIILILSILSIILRLHLNKPKIKKEENLTYNTKLFMELSPEKQTSSLTLNGIMYGTGEPWAIINNSIVKEGDEIGKAKLIEIHEDHVNLTSNGKEFILRIK